MREVLTRIHEVYDKTKEKVTTKCAKVGAVGMAVSGSVMAMTVPASADEVILTGGLANVKTLLDWAWTAITGNTFLFTIFCMSLASMSFGLMRSAKRSPR